MACMIDKQKAIEEAKEMTLMLLYHKDDKVIDMFDDIVKCMRNQFVEMLESLPEVET